MEGGDDCILPTDLSHRCSIQGPFPDGELIHLFWLCWGRWSLLIAHLLFGEGPGDPLGRPRSLEGPSGGERNFSPRRGKHRGRVGGLFQLSPLLQSPSDCSLSECKDLEEIFGLRVPSSPSLVDPRESYSTVSSQGHPVTRPPLSSAFSTAEPDCCEGSVKMSRFTTLLLLVVK